MMKASLDFGLGAVLTVPASPLMAALALAIRLTSGGPILEYIPVLGLHGTAFKTHRFRTHALSATSTPVAPRKFALGSFLYRTGLDKLPQLFDVLSGRLSLVSPRPISADSTQNNQRWSSSLFTVKPRLTGPWMVEKSASQREEQLLDLYYIRNWTIWLDLQVLYQAPAKLQTTLNPVECRLCLHRI
jgi:lipopolysaccharide/colanic/teichoic acid biosynthesis glycosyltransferase